MPKVVDHESRRADLAKAVWAVVARDGIEAATVRRVAEQAGMSMGGLRHYFDNQAGLLRFAALALGDRIGERVGAVLAGSREPAEVLIAMLPVDDERRVEAEVWLACLVRSRVDDSLAEMRSAGWAGTRHICRLAVALARGSEMPGEIGEPLTDGQQEEWAAKLHTLVDGLTLQAVMYPDRATADGLRAIVEEELHSQSLGDRAAVGA